MHQQYQLLKQVAAARRRPIGIDDNPALASSAVHEEEEGANYAR